MLASLLKISRGGQVSVPASIRKRWQTSRVLAEDRGDQLILRPAPDEPVDLIAGVLADYRKGIRTEEVRKEERQAEQEHEVRRLNR